MFVNQVDKMPSINVVQALKLIYTRGLLNKKKRQITMWKGKVQGWLIFSY